MASYQHGYEDERFENAVSRNFHCPICLNVFKDPVMCQRNQHFFCRPCITRHLENSQTCPSCMQQLTPDTLRQAPRIVLDYLSELNIRCDYFSRGCREFVQIEKLESHVKDCGFAPVVCSNEGCLMDINKRDRAHHEAEACELRKLKCHNCIEMTSLMEDMNKKLGEMQQMQLTLTTVKDKVDELKRQIDRLETLPEEMGVMKIKQDEIIKATRETQQGATNQKPSIVVAGGYGETQRLKSAEIFSWSTKSWSQLQPMKECRDEASSFVYQNQFIVTGGDNDLGTTNSMEHINIRPDLDHSVQWHRFPAKLPGRLTRHKTIVYNERLTVIGGREDSKGNSDKIHEILLFYPHATRLLARMPQPRAFHGVEIFKDKIFILGGKSGRSKGNLNSVLMFDINNNNCQQVMALPFPVHSMATVKWGDNVILLGGEDKEGKTLSTVIMYNVKTGMNHMLPKMKCKRQNCTAVVSGNTIVAIGGVNGEGYYLKSVEYFTFDSYSWEDITPMNEMRAYHTAVTL